LAGLVPVSRLAEMKLRPLDLQYLAYELKRHMDRLNKERLQAARNDKQFQTFLNRVLGDNPNK
jgi:hypothetical protein